MDVVVRAREEQGTGGYVVKDPIALRYYQLGDEEHFVWSRLDGRQTVSGLCAEFAEAFLLRQVSADELERFIRQLIAQGLVIGEHGRSAAQIQQRVVRQRWLQTLSQCFNVLAIRFRGVNPDRFLTQLLPWCAWLFSPWFLYAAMGLWLSAIGLWWTQADVFLARWPEEIALWTAQDLASLAVMLAGVKVVHELAHGLTCKRFGGTVSELGAMLLVFTPCLYCNVSDAWLLRSKWQRIAISAAGMIAEGVLAAIATWLWWASAPGPFHALCLQVVLICGVSTLVFNLNPLLRYDGYFMLADWFDQPNLHQQATAALGRRWWAAFTGNRVLRPVGRTLGYEWGLALFAAISGIYRLLVVIGLLWALHRWLEPQGYAVVANMIIAVTVIPLLAGIVAAVPPAVRDAWQQAPAARRTMGVRLTMTTVLLVAAVFVPLPCRVTAPVLLEPADAEMIHATRSGQLVRLAEPGQALGSRYVGLLIDPKDERELARASSELDRAKARLASIERRQLIDPQAGLQRPAVEQILHDWKARYEQRWDEHNRFFLLTSRDGVFWPAAARTDFGTRHELPTWTGSLHDEQNRGCWVEAGTHVGLVGSADQFEAVAYLSQSQVSDLRIGQTARIVLDATPYEFCTGSVTELAVATMPDVDPVVAARLQLPAMATTRGHQLLGTWYHVRMTVTSSMPTPIRRLGGVAAIAVAPQSLWERGRRWLGTTFPGW